jgi:hypothetical protein
MTRRKGGGRTTDARQEAPRCIRIARRKRTGAGGTAAAGWQDIGPVGGGVTSLAVDPTAPATVYAAAATGVWKTTDGGSQWLHTGNFFGASKVAVDRAAASTVYAVVNETLERSADGGASWQSVLPPPSAPACTHCR